MLSKCANPSCSAEFRYLHQGKVFFFKAAKINDLVSSRVDFAGRHDHLHYAWLCNKCVRKFDVVIDSDNNIRITPRPSHVGAIAVVGITLGLQLATAISVLGDLSELVA